MLTPISFLAFTPSVYTPSVLLSSSYLYSSVPMGPKPQTATAPEAATQSTNPFSSDNPRYEAYLPAQALVAQASLSPVLSAQAKGKGYTEPSRPLAQLSDTIVAKILPDHMRWLRLNQGDERTRLLFLPSDPDTFHLEHVGIPGADLNEGYLSS